MPKALDLDALHNVVMDGQPLDEVPVTRRWLAQVHYELRTLRGGVAVLDHAPEPSAAIAA